MALGPRHDRMISATVLEAEIFDNCALRPTCLSPAAVFITTTGACMMGGSVLSGDNRWKKGEFHG